MAGCIRQLLSEQVIDTIHPYRSLNNPGDVIADPDAVNCCVQ